MARRYCILMLVVSLFFIIGCQSGIDSGISRREPARTGTAPGPGSLVADAGEIDLVDQVVASRQAYRQELDSLVRYYNRTGNDGKLRWAEKELNALNAMPQYKYIIPKIDLRESKIATIIPEADILYDDGLMLEREAKFGGLFVTNPDKLRLALNKYEQIMEKYPTSDKIDDAAYRSGVISEYFKDVTIALDYYQQAYQWDPDTTFPARFRAARILDKNLRRKDEALKLYKEAIETEGRFGQNREWKQRAEERIAALEKTGS